MSALIISAVLCLFNPLEGTTSNKVEIGVRRDVVQLSASEKEAFLQGLYTMKSTPSKYDASWSTYDYYAWVHRYAFEYSSAGASGHNRWNFLPWHRGFAYLFEKELQEAMDDATFRLPYWDLTNEESTFAVLHDDSFLGGQGDVNNSNMLPDTTRLSCEDWPIDFRLINGTFVEDVPCLARRFGLHESIPTLPPAEEWWNVLNAGYDYDVEPYDDFVAQQQNTTQNMVVSYRARIEGIFGLFCNETAQIECTSLHNNIHRYIGGHITSPASPIDPVFLLLHNWIDVMWALYQDEYGLEHTFPEQFKNVSYFDGWFNGSQMNSMDVMDTRDLGYVYQIQIDRASSADEKEEWWTMENVIIVSVVAFCVVVALLCCVWLTRRSKKSSSTGNYQSI